MQLLDARWRRKSVGLIAGEGADALAAAARAAHLCRAGARADRRPASPPNAASTSEAVTGLIDRGASIIVLTETGTLPPDTTEALVEWVAGRRHAAPLRQPEPRRHDRRRAPAGAPPAGRARARRLALLGGAAADRRAFPPTARSPHIAVPDGRAREPAGARRSRRASRRGGLGGAARRHAARHRRAREARAASCSSMSPPIRAGRTCRSPARSWRC